METAEDKQWASRYLLDPLNEPGPSEETGPGTHYRSTFANPSSSNLSSTSTSHKKQPSVTTKELGHTQSRASAGTSQKPPRSSRHGGSRDDSYVAPKTMERPSTEIPTSNTTGGRTRATSLSSRYIGDDSHRPLDIIKKENKAANRAPHLRKKHLVGPDAIDRLDTVGGIQHHAGPYDATYLARNTSFMNSPVEAVSGTNEETLKATPREKVLDSITKHRPLDGVAAIPSGLMDRSGNTLRYEEGADLMIEAGYKRWPGVKYLPEDLKGKGEPSYTLEKTLKEHKQQHRRGLSEGQDAIEMNSRPRRASGEQQPYRESQQGLRRSNTGGKKSRGLSLLKKRGNKDD